jgi:hypothetical protein
MQTKNAKHKHESNMFPVIKFSLDNKVIYHNQAAMPFMGIWGCELDKKIPNQLNKVLPGVFNPDEKFQTKDVNIPYKEYLFRFSMVPFKEAGYVGLYAYSVELNGIIQPESVFQTLMA